MTSHKCNASNENDICKAANAMHPVLKAILALAAIAGLVYTLGASNTTRDTRISNNETSITCVSAKVEEQGKAITALDKKSAVTDTKLDTLQKTADDLRDTVGKIDEKLDVYLNK